MGSIRENKKKWNGGFLYILHAVEMETRKQDGTKKWKFHRGLLSKKWIIHWFTPCRAKRIWTFQRRRRKRRKRIIKIDENHFMETKRSDFWIDFEVNKLRFINNIHFFGKHALLSDPFLMMGKKGLPRRCEWKTKGKNIYAEKRYNEAAQPKHEKYM